MAVVREPQPPSTGLQSRYRKSVETTDALIVPPKRTRRMFLNGFSEKWFQ
jgi:hypothetical protein